MVLSGALLLLKVFSGEMEEVHAARTPREASVLWPATVWLLESVACPGQFQEVQGTAEHLN